MRKTGLCRRWAGLSNFAAVWIFAMGARASIIQVPSAAVTIQAAINSASTYDEVVVAAGTYYENIQFLGKNITVRSTDPTSAAIVAATIIDGSFSGPVVQFAGTEQTSCILAGLTIRNGVSPSGGGVHGGAGAYSFATIRDNLITSNTATGASGNTEGCGGGLYRCRGSILRNTISNNWAAKGGGGIFGSDGTVEANSVTSNTAVGSFGGGGLSNCGGSIRRNLISGNACVYKQFTQTLGFGGGLCSCSGDIEANTITNNVGYQGGGLCTCTTVRDCLITSNSAYFGAGADDLYCMINDTVTSNSGTLGGGLYGCYGLIMNCIVSGNTAPTSPQIGKSSPPQFSCVDGMSSGNGNITGPPQFVNAAAGDYRLTVTSPCVDAGFTDYLNGQLQTDASGLCRLAGSRVDIGAFEYNSAPDTDGDLLSDAAETAAGANPNKGDTDNDGLPDGIEVIRGTSPTVVNTKPGLNVPADFTTLQRALFLAFPGEVITVSSGVYSENPALLGKNVSVRSTAPTVASVVDSTIIDGGALGAAFVFQGSESSACELRGLTFRNGSAGGILAQGTRALIANCSVTSNSNSRGGGGISSAGGTLQDCRITSNVAAMYGGGLYACSGSILRDYVLFNKALDNSFPEGGGLRNCSGTIRDCVIAGNACYGFSPPNTYYAVGNGSALAQCDGDVQNNTIVLNSAGSGSALYYLNGRIENCIIWENRNLAYTEIYQLGSNVRTPEYCDIQFQPGTGTGCISADPIFANMAAYNFQLTAGSPCVDSGKAVSGLTVDMPGVSRPFDAIAGVSGDGSNMDMGAYEYVPANSMVSNWSLY